MRIFVAGATGVIGIRLVRLLVIAGHDVAGMTRSPDKTPMLRALGVAPVACDVFDPQRLIREVHRFRAVLLVHLLTDLPDDARQLRKHTAANARIRREGTGNLLTAARAARVRRVFAESVAWDLGGDAAAAKDELEKAVLGTGGVVLRYGQLYGPGTYYENDMPKPPRVHIDEAARRTVASLAAPSGVITITDAA
jgi:nucleoside-diphosphate-sugar epimerase